MKCCIDIHLEFILYYITLTHIIIIVNDTFISQVITALLLIWKEKNNTKKMSHCS